MAYLGFSYTTYASTVTYDAGELASTGSSPTLSFWSSKINGSLNNGTPAVNSYWGSYTPAYAWFADTNNSSKYTLKTDSIKTETHDLFVGSVYHNVGGDGTLYIEQSPDNKNWDVSDTVTVATATATSFSKAIVSPFLRLRFVASGATNAVPTTFRLNGKTSDSSVKY